MVLPAATLAAVVAAASVVDLAAPPVEEVAVNSMCPTFVVPDVPLVMLRFVVSQGRIDRIPISFRSTLAGKT